VAVLRLLAAFDLRPASNTLGSMKSRSCLAVDTRQSHLANPSLDATDLSDWR